MSPANIALGTLRSKFKNGEITAVEYMSAVVAYMEEAKALANASEPSSEESSDE